MRPFAMYIAAACLLSACATAPRETPSAGALPADGPVAVRWENPAAFTEVRQRPAGAQRDDFSWIPALARHLRDSAAGRIADGEQLDITVTDIDLAGDYEPWRNLNQDVRIVRDIYPPRMRLYFTLRDSQGNVVSEGERRLSDLGFLQGSGLLDTDPLRYEKRMIDSWTRREFQPKAGP